MKKLILATVAVLAVIIGTSLIPANALSFTYASEKCTKAHRTQLTLCVALFEPGNYGELVSDTNVNFSDFKIANGLDSNVTLKTDVPLFLMHWVRG